MSQQIAQRISGNFTCCHSGIRVQIRLAFSFNHTTLTAGQPVLALTLEGRTPGRVTIRVLLFRSLVGLDRGQRDTFHTSSPRPSTRSSDKVRQETSRSVWCKSSYPCGERVATNVLFFFFFQKLKLQRFSHKPFFRSHGHQRIPTCAQRECV